SSMSLCQMSARTSQSLELRASMSWRTISTFLSDIRDVVSRPLPGVPSRRSPAAPKRRPVFDQLPAPGLVLIGIASVQIGAAFATKLFVHLGPAGTAFLRVLFAAVVLWAIWRPRPTAHTSRDLRLAAVFGLALAFMN